MLAWSIECAYTDSVCANEFKEVSARIYVSIYVHTMLKKQLTHKI